MNSGAHVSSGLLSSASGILEQVGRYYSQRLKEFGATPRGVDWRDAEGQRLRLSQLARVIDIPDKPSLVDVGCGYGALVAYLDEVGIDVHYAGFDVSEEMILAAKLQNQGRANTRFEVGAVPDVRVDFAVASGIFNVKLDIDVQVWREYVEEALDVLHAASRRGFAFNCLTKYSDPPKMRDDLFYADPCELFDLCQRRYSRRVSLIHDYGLYEFTILVRKA